MAGRNLKLREALEFAIYRETGARNYYSCIADKIKNPDGKGKFQQISKDEEGHRVKLESWFKKLFGEDFIATPEGLEDSEIKDLNIDEKTGALEALDIAIEAEAEANEFYKTQGERADNPELKKLFFDLAEEEKGHYNLLEAERNSLIGGFYWFDMDSTSFMED